MSYREWFRRRFGLAKEGHIRADREFDHQLPDVRRVGIVKAETLAHFAGRDADNGIGIRVIGRRAAEDFDADASFLEL